MKFRVIVRPEAEDDIEQAFSWYEDKGKGLGHDFLLQVKTGLSFLEKSPKVFPAEYKGVRKYLLKRFPYKIVYLIEQNKIIVLAVIHGRRNPDLVKKRRDNI